MGWNSSSRGGVGWKTIGGSQSVLGFLGFSVSPEVAQAKYIFIYIL